MKFEIVKLKSYTGIKSTVYSFIYEEDNSTLYDRFIIENINDHTVDIEAINELLNVIGHKTGAREIYFKPNQGKPGDLLCYLKYKPSQILRLYCIRYGSTAIILGGGGKKITDTLQQDKKLKTENYALREISKRIYQAFKDDEIEWSVDGKELLGNLKIEADE